MASSHRCELKDVVNTVKLALKEILCAVNSNIKRSDLSEKIEMKVKELTDVLETTKPCDSASSNKVDNNFSVISKPLDISKPNDDLIHLMTNIKSIGDPTVKSCFVDLVSYLSKSNEKHPESDQSSDQPSDASDELLELCNNEDADGKVCVRKLGATVQKEMVELNQKFDRILSSEAHLTRQNNHSKQRNHQKKSWNNRKKNHQDYKHGKNHINRENYWTQENHRYDCCSDNYGSKYDHQNTYNHNRNRYYNEPTYYQYDDGNYNNSHRYY